MCLGGGGWARGKVWCFVCTVEVVVVCVVEVLVVVEVDVLFFGWELVGFVLFFFLYFHSWYGNVCCVLLCMLREIVVCILVVRSIHRGKDK